MGRGRAIYIVLAVVWVGHRWGDGVSCGIGSCVGMGSTEWVGHRWGDWVSCIDSCVGMGSTVWVGAQVG